MVVWNTRMQIIKRMADQTSERNSYIILSNV